MTRLVGSRWCIVLGLLFVVSALPGRAEAAGANPSTVAFGTVPINTTVTSDVTITVDAGYRTQLASGSGINVPFSFDFDSCGAGGGFAGPGTCTVKQSFRPTSATASSGTTNVFECPVAGGTCIAIPYSVTGTGVTPGPDSTPPVISIVSPLETVYARGQVVNADYSCTDADSGIATCAGPVPNGSAIDTSTLGSHTFTVTAKDVAGNPASASRTYKIVDAVTGRMTSKGSFGAFSFATLTNCTPGAAGNTIQGQSGSDVFKLTSVDRVVCYRDESAPYLPSAGFNTQFGAGRGTWNGAPGYTIEWTLLDGATGADDRVTMVIRSPQGAKVIDVAGAPGPFPGASQPTGLVTATR